MTSRSVIWTVRTSRLRGYGVPLATSHGLHRVRSTLARWGLDGDCDEATDAVLVAGELLANARQHGGGAQSVDLSWHGDRLRVAVSDGSREAPRLVLPHRPSRPSGHGMYVVERLARKWGVLSRPDGKTVWAELRMPRRFGLPPPALPPPRSDGPHP
jgi:anti-sigma regulatory factor (Ser/Thr protein kinase)